MSNTNFTNMLVIESAAIDTTKEPTYKASLGAVNLRQWETMVVLNIGDDAKGMTQVELVQANQITGFFNGLFKVVDHPENFRMLKVGAHMYAFGEREFKTRAGYVSVINPDEHGIDRKVWLAQTWNGDSYSTAYAVKPVPYAIAKDWKSNTNKDQNRKNQNIVDLHNGIDLVIRLLAGEISIKFDLRFFGDQRYNAVSEKILLFAQSKEARDETARNAAIRGEITRETNAMHRVIAKAQEEGRKVELTEEAKGMTVVVINTLGESESRTPAQLLGLSVNFVRKGGFPTGIIKTIHTIEDAAKYMGDLAISFGEGSYFEIVAE